MVENPPANAEDMGSIPGLGRSPGVRSGNPFQYACLENPMDTGDWWAIVHGVTKSQKRLKRLNNSITLCVFVCVCAYIYIYISHLYPFICPWTLRLTPYLGYCEYYNEHGSVDYLEILISYPLDIYLE